MELKPFDRAFEPYEFDIGLPSELNHTVENYLSELVIGWYYGNDKDIAFIAAINGPVLKIVELNHWPRYGRGDAFFQSTREECERKYRLPARCVGSAWSYARATDKLFRWIQEGRVCVAQFPELRDRLIRFHPPEDSLVHSLLRLVALL